MSKADETFGAFVKSLGGVDWDTLHSQKQALIDAVSRRDASHPFTQVLDGIINFIDALQDDAVDQAKIWTFPPDPDTGEQP